MRNRQLGIKARAGSLSEFLEEGEHSDREERSFDELAEEGDVGAIKEQFGSRSARNRRKKRQLADRHEAELERRLERAKRSQDADDAAGDADDNDGGAADADGDAAGASAVKAGPTIVAGATTTTRIVPIADVIAAETAAGPKRKAPVIAATDDDEF